MAKDPKSRSTIRTQVHRAILERRLGPGTKLGEEALSEIYGVSRAQIRRVLVDLSHAKVVELRPNRGAYVAQPSVREARHVFEARRAIEVAMVERAVDRMTDVSLAKLQEIVDADRAALARGDSEAAIKLSGDFHLCLGEIAGNQAIGLLRRRARPSHRGPARWRYEEGGHRNDRASQSYRKPVKSHPG
jgi:DNA-binding GntR family transcriptional regulator